MSPPGEGVHCWIIRRKSIRVACTTDPTAESREHAARPPGCFHSPPAACPPVARLRANTSRPLPVPNQAQIRHRRPPADRPPAAYPARNPTPQANATHDLDATAAEHGQRRGRPRAFPAPLSRGCPRCSSPRARRKARAERPKRGIGIASAPHIHIHAKSMQEQVHFSPHSPKPWSWPRRQG